MGFFAKTTTDSVPGISTFEHMINTGCEIRCFVQAVPSLFERFQMNAAELGAIAALHDPGKISPVFQQKSQQWSSSNNLERVAKTNRRSKLWW